MYLHFGKRTLDIVLSFLAIVVLAIPMLIIAVAIKVNDPGPVLFRQKRVGKGKTYFMLYKFRSMKVGTPDLPTHLMKDPERYTTGIGKFLRRTSLDELPQLFNILTGKMSIVGPRPALWNQEDLVALREPYGANDVLPGLTGWAQINGRDELALEEKARLDGEYVENIRFLFDCRCVCKTVLSVLKHDGVVEGGKNPEKGQEIARNSQARDNEADSDGNMQPEKQTANER